MKFFILMLAAVVYTTATAQKGIDNDILKRLDRELELKATYDQRKIDRIDSLRNIDANSLEERYQVLCEVAREYETFVSDSALA